MPTNEGGGPVRPEPSPDSFGVRLEDQEPGDEFCSPRYSDDALALRFSDRFHDQLRYTATWGRWFLWTGKHWVADETLKVFSMVRRICRQASAECTQIRLAARIASAGVVAAVERLARADRRHAMEVENWDRNQWVLNTPSGTVDLRTGELKPHRCKDHLTKIAAAAPGGGCPIWKAFLRRITNGDTELQGFLQRVVGYWLTGVTREHAIFFFYGTGSNGKSVFIETISNLLNDYATVAAMETFIATTAERHPTDLAKLHGARLVTAVETEEGRRWAESKLKSLTGGDKITARFMRQDFFEYMPQFKLVVAGNHRPAIRNVDEAMRRRIHLIPFTITIPASERDLELKDKLMAEWPGILAWAIEGCLQWQAQGLNPPESVRSATEEYLATEDVLGRWMEENTVLGHQYYSSSSALYEDWKKWCDENREYVCSLKQFSQKMESRSEVTKVRKEDARGFQGIGLKVDVLG